MSILLYIRAKKVRNSLSVVLCGIMCVILSACGDKYPDEVVASLENRSGEPIFVYWRYRNAPFILDDVLEFFQGSNALIQDGETYRYINSVGSMEENQYENLNLIIFKLSTLERYSKKELIDNEIYDAWYTIPIEELDAMGYKIVYTGEKEFKP